VRIFCTFLVSLLLCSCSTLRLAYDNAEIYLRWRASDYLDLEGAQADERDEAIRSFMTWHRANALPKYATLADEAGHRFARGLASADLVWGYDSVMTQGRESLRIAAQRIAPLLDRLTPEQIAELERGLAEGNRKFARENLRGNERERRKRRTERNVERLEDWLGRLTQAQIDRVAQYSQRAPLLDDLRDRDHKRLQGELLAMVRAKQARERLPELAANWDRGRDAAYVSAIEAARKEYFAMALDIDHTLSAKQRERAANKLQRYAEDFRTLAREGS
jgi:hypothetical protein